MTGNVNQRAATNMTTTNISNADHSLSNSKSQKYIHGSQLRPEDDHPGIGQTAHLPAARKTPGTHKTKYKARRHRQQQRHKSLARASTGSVSSLDSDVSRTEHSRKGSMGVNLDAVDQLATAVVSSSQEENPVASQDLRRQLTHSVKPEANAYRGRKQTQRKRSSTQRKAKRNATVRVKEFQFVPRSCTVQLGGKVTFRVVKDVDASFCLDGLTTELVHLKVGETYTQTLDSLGVIRYTCTKQASMVGRINVVSPNSPKDRRAPEGSVAQSITHHSQAHNPPLSRETQPAKVLKSKRSRRKTRRTRRKKQSFSSEEVRSTGSHGEDAVVDAQNQAKHDSVDVLSRKHDSDGRITDGFDVSAAVKFLSSRWETTVTVL